MHADVDITACWDAFQASPFFAHLPHCQWPYDTWTLQRVQTVLATMREGSAPGLRGIPIAV